MLGGFYAPTAAGARVAFIMSSKARCTGTLVGKHLVLTAAHCVYEDGDPANYTVVVDGASQSVASVWHETGFDLSRPIVEVRPYDLGMIVLAQDVKKKAPIPILVGRKPRPRQRLFIAGFGLSERSSNTMRTYKEAFKIGEIQLDGTDNEVLYSSHRATQTSVCGGDSGGPALQYYGNHIAIVGVASTGTNTSRKGRCVLSQGGHSAHVDIQSSNSLQFLAAFEGVEYATWGNMVIAKVVDEMKPHLAKAIRSRSHSKLTKIVTQNLQRLRRVRTKGTEDRRILLEQAITALEDAKHATSLSKGLQATKEARRIVARIAALGVT